MAEFCWAAQTDLPGIRTLWQTAFGDPSDYIDEFFQICFTENRVLILREQGQLTSMATVFRASIGGELVWYLYAVATDPIFRGAGFATALMEQAALLAEQETAAGIVLLPASASLQAFYGARGYRPWGMRTEQVFLKSAVQPVCRVHPVSAADYGALRAQRLQELAYLDFEPVFLQLQAETAVQSGGFLAALELEGVCGCAVIYKDAGKLLVPELLIAPQLRAKVAAALLAQFGAAQCRASWPGAGCAYGMLRPLRNVLPEQGYLGLALD